MMSSKSILTEAALDYLRSVAKTLEAHVGRNPRYLQHSEWMVRTSPTGMSGQEFTREVFDIYKASMVYQKEFLHANPPQQQRLIEALVTAGIEPQETHYGFLSPLVHHWLGLEDPLAFDEGQISKILDEFNDAILEGLIFTRSRSAIVMLELEAESLSLEKGISIRPISENELWEFGGMNNLRSILTPLSGLLRFVGEHWKILDIEIQHKKERLHPPEIIESVHRTVLTALALASPGHLQVNDLGTTANYGMGSLGTTRTGRPMPREIGRWGGQYVLNVEVSKRLRDLWPHLRKIMEAVRHYLRIPAQRLVDGGGRYREDDAVIDYAIALEALLMKGINIELGYRFGLRGATVLASKHGEKGKFFRQLQDFYDVRSKIVHGNYVGLDKLREARSNGERALRDIWWWFFENKEPLSRALARIDKVILK